MSLNLFETYESAQQLLKENQGQVNKAFKKLNSGCYLVEVVDVQHQVSPWGQEQLSFKLQVVAGEEKGVNEFAHFVIQGVSDWRATRNMANIIQLGRSCGVMIASEDIQGNPTDIYERLALKFQATLHHQVTMDLKVTPRKDKPESYNRYYNFESPEVAKQKLQQPQQNSTWQPQQPVQQQPMFQQSTQPMPTEDDMPF